MSVDNLTAGIVSILRKNGTIAGTGFIVSDDGLIATCMHVLESAQAGPEDKIKVHFQIGHHEGIARIIGKWWCDSDKEDIAILQIEGDIPEGVRSLKLGSSAGTSGHKVRVFGFPEIGKIEGVWGQGEVVGKVAEGDYSWIQLRSSEITAGFSGAPVWDESKQRVIGMVVTITKSDVYSRLQETAFAIPSETIQAICPELKIEEICPYRGLLPFLEDDNRFFFGRKALIDELVDQLRCNPRFLAVVGSSGSGKSSVVRAGLLPQIYRGEVPGFNNAKIIIFRPDAAPNKAFKKSLQESDILNGDNGPWEHVRSYLEKELESRVVIFSDQFEELFALTPEHERTDFLKELSDLLKSHLPITVIIAIRADFYEPLLSTPIGEYLRTGQFNVRAMSEEEMREAIISPSEIVGLEIETGLADIIIKDLKSTKNPLPLLEFALTQLWFNKKNGMLTLEKYRKIGGATGAIGQWAAEMYNQLSAAERQLCPRIFTRLVHYGERDAPDTRCRVPLSELAGSDEKQVILPLIKKLADSRLLVTDRDIKTGVETAEIIHESLLREWLQLKEWIQDQRSFLLWRQRLDEKLDEWQDKGQDEGSLLRSASLVEAEGWLKERYDDLNSAEQKYIRTSLELHKKEIADRERRKRRIITGLAVFSFITLLLAGFSVLQWQHAEEQRDTAVARQLAFQSELVGENSSNLAVLLAIESLKKKETQAGNQALLNGFELLPHPFYQMNHNHSVLAVAFSPDGKYLATASFDNTSKIWDVDTGKQHKILDHDGPVRAVNFSPDSKYVVTASEDRTARIWDVDTGKQLKILNHSGTVRAVTFSPDGNYVATASWDHTARIWDVDTKKQPIIMEHGGKVNGVAFSPDGKYLATASFDRTARIWEWDVDTEKQLKIMYHEGIVEDITFSPDGKYLATASWDKTARIWDVDSGDELARIEGAGPSGNYAYGYGAQAWAITFSPDGKYLATGNEDNTARIWDVDTGKQLKIIWHKAHVLDITFSPDGKYLATVSNDHTARIWDMETEKQLAIMEDVFWRGTFSPDGKYLATASMNKARMWKVDTGKLLATMENDEEVHDVAFSPDGKYLATASFDQTSRIWNVDNGKQLKILDHNGSVWALTFSPNGKYLATASFDNTSRIGDVDNGKQLKIMKHNDTVVAVNFSPDSKYLATASLDNTARIWDVETGEQLKIMKHDSPVPTVTFSPDGKYLATASGNTARIWDVDTGKLLKIMEHYDVVWTLTFSPDGKYLATASENTASIWEVKTGEKFKIMVHTPYYYRAFVLALTFSPDGKYLATASNDQTARIWKVSTGRQLKILEHGSLVEDITFSPDVKYLATASGNTARIWDVETGKQLEIIEHDGPVRALTFSPDGKRLATASSDRKARIWIWRLNDRIDEACSRLTRNLSSTEWKTYMGDEEEYHKTCPELP